MNPPLDVRPQILGEAKRQFLERGPAATTIESVCAGVGCNAADFERHWSSMDDLRHELLQAYTAGEFAIIDQIFSDASERDSDPVAQALAFFRLFYEDFLRDWYEQFQVPPTGDLFSVFIYGREGVDSDSYRLAVDGLSAWIDRFTDIVRPVVDASSTATEETADELARMMVSINLGAIIVGRATNDPFLLTRQQHLFEDYLERIANQRP